MTSKTNPADQKADKDKFSPKNVADEGPDKGRMDRDMLDVSRGSSGDRRRAADGAR